MPNDQASKLSALLKSKLEAALPGIQVDQLRALDSRGSLLDFAPVENGPDFTGCKTIEEAGQRVQAENERKLNAIVDNIRQYVAARTCEHGAYGGCSQCEGVDAWVN